MTYISIRHLAPRKSTTTMGRLNTAEFIERVRKELTENDGSLSVYLTQKRLTSALEVPPTDAVADLASNVVDHPTKYQTNNQAYPVLLRFTTGDKLNKISTVVNADELDAFWTEYIQVLKGGFVNLKKKEKKKQKKAKVTKP